jgi:acetyl-CoA synthetase
MSTASKSASENISNLLSADDEYQPPAIVLQNCQLKDWKAEFQKSFEDPDAFWGDYARNFVWSRPWTKVREWKGAQHKWFVGGKTNICVNALDRHNTPEYRNRVAYIWLAEDGAERVVTYGQLYRMVCQFANGLKSLGLKKGDRVIIYMPLTIEGVTAMLACARIGVIHSVVYAGLGHTALRKRILDAGARVIIAGDVGYRRGKTVALKPIVDEAIDGLESVEQVVVFSRANTELSGSEIDFNQLLKFPAECPAEEMDSEDPLFLL